MNVSSCSCPLAVYMHIQVTHGQPPVYNVKNLPLRFLIKFLLFNVSFAAEQDSGNCFLFLRGFIFIAARLDQHVPNTSVCPPEDSAAPRFETTMPTDIFVRAINTCFSPQ